MRVLTLKIPKKMEGSGSVSNDTSFLKPAASRMESFHIHSSPRGQFYLQIFMIYKVLNSDQALQQQRQFRCLLDNLRQRNLSLH